MKSNHRLLPLPTALVGLVVVSACGSGSDGQAAASSGNSVVQVVTSTNVWGSIVSSVGGDHVNVSSFIADPSQDPHSYQANPQNQLAISKAALVVENGGGYDDFMATMLDAADRPDTKVVVNAVQVSGKSAKAGGGLNEHVWYDLPTVVKVANRVAGSLGTLDPAHAAEFRTNAAKFATSLTPITDTLARIKQQHPGAPVAITEPVPGYLLEAAGVVNKTPPEFSEAVENGGDLAPAVLQQTLQLFSNHQVDALVYNDQTSGAATDAVKQAASRAQVPAVAMTETLPEGQTFEQWMQANADALAAALDEANP